MNHAKMPAHHRTIQRLFFYFCLWWCGIYLLIPVAAEAQFEEVTSKTFAVHYRSIDEFLSLANALLSKKGIITKSTTINAMVIQDYPANLARVDSLLERFDTPLHQLRVSIRLVLGSIVTEEEQILRNPAIESLIKDRYGFNRIEFIEEGLIMTEETSLTKLDLGNGQFLISFLPIYLPLETPAIELRNFTFTSVKRGMSGEERKQLLNTAITMTNDDEQILGAMKYGLRDQTLLVIVRMEILD